MDVSRKNFEHLLGGELSTAAEEILLRSDFRYRTLTDRETDDALIRYVSFLMAPKKRSGPDYQQIWESGWNENLIEFVASGDPSALVPKFVKSKQIIRYDGGMVIPYSEGFETDFVSVIRDFFFRSYFSDAPAVVEFGCGTSSNLVHLSTMFPDMRIFGTDWASSSLDLIREINFRLNLRIEGRYFDLFRPDRDFVEEIPDGAGVFTMGALEQLGDKYSPFLSFLLESNVGTVVHFETAYELYHPENLWDFLAVQYIEKRNWLRGYFKELENLEAEGRIKIVHQGKTFGSFFHDGYTVTVWEKV